MSSPFQPGATVAAYARDSGGESQELSVGQQLDAFRTFCMQNGLIPGTIFSDVATPGSSTVGRSGFLGMMDHFRRGAAEVGLVIWSYSRFARDFDDMAFYRADLRRRGYILHSLNDSIPEGNMGRLYEAVIDWRNSSFLEELSRDVKRGLNNLVSQYGAVPGTPPRGFIRQPVEIGTHRDGRPHVAHRWAPDPDKIGLVRRAFDMLLAGNSLAEIQRETRLYRSINSWTTFFRNRLYKGALVFGDLVIGDYCEPVVDPRVWDQAQAIITKRSRRRHLAGDNPHHPRREKSSYILSGLAYCAHCGSPLSGSTERAHRPDDVDYIYQRYICSRARRNRDCDAEGIPRLFLEEMVIKIVTETLFSTANMIAIQQLAMKTESERRTEMAEKTAELRVSLGPLRHKIGNVTDALAEQGSSRALLVKLSDLEAEEADVLGRLGQMEVQAGEMLIPLSEDQIRAMAERVRIELAGRDPLAARRILHGLLRRIVVEREENVVRVMVEYFYPPGDIMPISLAPVGAPAHRYSYVYTCTVPFRRKKRTTRKQTPIG